MRIFFITSKMNFETSGGSVAELDLKIRTLKDWGHDIKVVTVFSRENRIKTLLSYELFEENISSKRLLTIQNGVFKILKKYSSKTDIFHIDGHLFLYGAGFYKMIGGKVPVVAHFNRELLCWPENISSFLKKEKNKQNILIRIKKKSRWLIEKYIGMFLANYIDLFSFTTPALKATYENFGLRKIRSFTIGDLVDHKKMRVEAGVSEDFYIKRNKTSEIINIFYTGRMAPGKGFDTLLIAFSKIRNKEGLILTLGGSGPEEVALHQLAQDLGIAQYVKFLGWLTKKEVYDNFKMADIFVLPKCMRLEFNSVTLLEAMVFGLPCVVPAGGGLAWGAGKGALTYEDENCDDLAVKIEKLAVDYRLREQLSRNCAFRLADDEWTYTKQVEKLNERLTGLIQKR